MGKERGERERFGSYVRGGKGWDEGLKIRSRGGENKRRRGGN